MMETRANMAITNDQQKVLEIVARTASTLSALGVITIIAVFSLARHFRNPMHRLIFINAFYNAFDVVCTMISVSGPAAGNDSALCQFQGFLNQMFPLADVSWTLAMAVNVFLIVFRRYDTVALRRLEWKYMVGITTLTFIPAFAFLFVQTQDKGHLYGSVTVWCSIAPKWVLIRILLYYIPIWCMIFAAMVLYVLVGVEIFRRGGIFQSVNQDSIPLDDGISSTAGAASPNCDKGLDLDAEVDFRLQPGHVFGSHSRVESLPGTQKHSIITTRSDVLILPVSPPRHSSLSLRQYILMPLFFFLALLTVWVAPSTNRVASFINPDYSSYPLLVAVGATGSLRGFWNGIIFITLGMKSWKKGNQEQRGARRQQ